MPKSLYEKILQAEKATTVQEIVDKENSKRLRVHMPCKVVQVHKNSVDVEIQGKEDSGFGYYTEFPLLLDLPIVYNNYTSKAYIITPIQVGDTGLVEFLDFNISNFANNGNTAITSDSYPHALNNGVFINGFIPNSKMIDIDDNTLALVLGLHNGNFSFKVSDDGQLNISSNKGVTIDSPKTFCSKELECGNGATGTFVSKDNRTVTVNKGIITSIS